MLKRLKLFTFILYDNTNIKTKRIIKPYFVGENTYSGKKFLGVNAFCLERNDKRVFKVDRILEIRTV